MGKVFPVGGHIRFEDAGRRVWSSDGRPANLLPEETWQTIGVTINFPDFVKGNAYGYARTVIDAPFPSGGTFFDTAVITTILPQEWGPGVSGAQNLPTQVLGTIPAGNYIDVRATLSRTRTPSRFIDISAGGISGGDVLNMVPAQQSLLRGGSCLCESTYIWRRLFEVVLSGNQIVLNRYQSVWDNGETMQWASGNNPYVQDRWTYGGPSGANKGHPAYFERSRRSYYSLPEPWRGGANGLPLDDSSNYSARWAGTLLIRPGYLVAAA
ncbi:hypothetical protein XM25_07765 [Devosia sp. H5989]|nr:hypothetical protein XM25_07765 [Devosia sp. H5989]